MSANFKSLNEIMSRYNILFYDEHYINLKDGIIDIFNGNINKYRRKKEYYIYLGLYYNYNDKHMNHNLMKKYYLMAADNGNNNGLHYLGLYYHNKYKFDLMEKYYIMAINNGNAESMFEYALFNWKILGNYETAKLYLSMAVDKKHPNAMYALGNYYCMIEKTNVLAKKYYLMAIKHNSAYGYFGIITYYKDFEYNPELMCKYFKEAIKFRYIIINTLKKYYGTDRALLIIYSVFGIKYIPVYDLNNPILINFMDKIKNNCIKQNECLICYDEDVECLHLKNCDHTLCVKCYIELIDKPCPFCRQ
jgi:TPR repeat protein